MAVLKIKLAGSTIIEAITAMVIIMTCMGIALSSFSRLSRDVNDELRIDAEIKLNTYAVETKKQENYTEAEKDLGNLILRRKVINLSPKTTLKELIIEAYTPTGAKVGELKEIIVYEPSSQKNNAKQ